MEKKTLDDIYDGLTQKQKEWVDDISDNMQTIIGLYRDKFWRDGGWNGMMGAINEYEKLNKLKRPDFDDLPEDVDIYELIINDESN